MLEKTKALAIGEKVNEGEGLPGKWRSPSDKIEIRVQSVRDYHFPRRSPCGKSRRLPNPCPDS
ncbi:hypothetical protein [Phormidium sp. CCY1219]|uniref:hypothetical protein n=1 Tax=Phormidium sp. CCY1219 TaxID=2886104 RepID=UPI002D1ECB73|nr:hypothetical protein [Phormidium sp. CCY1219]MEB3826335.1 hypothetical protein [Phormidium sp. CCY1219]